MRVYSFPVGEEEKILKKDHASMAVGGQAYNGALYLTNERIVFVGYLMDIRNKYVEEVSLYHVKEIKPEKSLLVIPNAMRIVTIQDRTIKIVVSKRNEWYAEICRKMEEIGLKLQ